MIYSDLYTKNQTKIPSILAYGLIVFLVVFFTWVFSNKPNYSKAALTKVRQVEVTNVSPVQVTIYWESNQKEPGWVVFGTNRNNVVNVQVDDRDAGSTKNSYLNHLVTLKNLDDNRKYYYKIISGDKLVESPDGGPFSFQTPSSTSLIQSGNVSPAYAPSVQYSNGSPVEDAIVLLTVNGPKEQFFPLLTTTKSPDGSFLIPLNTFYNENTLTQQTLPGSQNVTLQIIDQEGQQYTVLATISQLSQLSTLQFKNGGTYVFGSDKATQKVLGAETSVKPQKSPAQIDIIYPEENALIPGLNPLIKGTALPGSSVSISVHSKESYSAVVVADSKGNWSYVLPQNLSLGNHVITIQSKDSAGQLITVKRNFTLIANGNEGKVLGVASSEATITPTLPPSPTPTVYIPITSTIAPTSSPPVTGETDNLPAFGGMSLIIVGLGLILVY